MTIEESQKRTIRVINPGITAGKRAMGMKRDKGDGGPV